MAGRMWAGLGQANAPPLGRRATGTLERFRVGDERPENPGRHPRVSPSATVLGGGARQFRDSKAIVVDLPVRSRTMGAEWAGAVSVVVRAGGWLSGTAGRERRGIGKDRLRAWDAAVTPPVPRLGRRGEGRETSSGGPGASRIPLMNSRARASSTSSSVFARAKVALASAAVVQGRGVTGVLKGGITNQRWSACPTGSQCWSMKDVNPMVSRQAFWLGRRKNHRSQSCERSAPPM